MGDEIFSVYLTPADYSKLAYAKLDLPASPWKLLDAMDKVRLPEGDSLYLEITDYRDFEVLRSSLVCSATNLLELNDLAERLSRLNEVQRIAFEGLVRVDFQKQESITLKRLRDLAESVDCCHVVESVVSDGQLGRFYAENGFVPEVEGMSDAAFELLDFEKVGKMARMGECGVYVPSGISGLGGYVVQHSDLKSAPEITLNQPVEPAYTIHLRLTAHHDNLPFAGTDVVDLKLPAEDNALEMAVRCLGYAQPKDEPAKLLSELPELLQSMGLSLWRDGSDYLENSYLAYELKPVEDPEADWRLDVYTGSCRLPVLINDYLTARSDMVDEYHKDGIAAGFLLYPLSGFTGEERVKAILDFRDNLRDAILRDAGEEAVTFLGGATGLYCGYLDFIAWDLPAVLTAAQAFFERSDLPYAHFHAFRRDVGGVPLLDEKEPEPDIHEETGSLLSAEDIETLESFDEGTAAYFGKMLDWLENFIKSGVEEGRFSEKQAHQDLQIALWYAFACLKSSMLI